MFKIIFTIVGLLIGSIFGAIIGFFIGCYMDRKATEAIIQAIEEERRMSR